MAEGGRPTKYKPEYDDVALEYATGGYIEHGQVVPSKVGLALILGVKPDTLDDWAKRHDTFSGTLDLIHSKQHIEALNRGLDGTFNAAITKLLLHNHGYSDKQSQEVSGPNGEPIKTESKVEWTIQPVKPINEADS